MHPYRVHRFFAIMNKNAPEICSLRQEIERNIGRHLRTPYDFEYLAAEVWKRQHEPISPTTLKRLWGYISGAETTRHSTLCILAQFLGYADWETYLSALTARTDAESAMFAGEGIRSDELRPGQTVEVTWLPDRRCIFRYEGANSFTVIEAHNAKLQSGDRFEAACFIIGKPLYADRLTRGSEPQTSYVAGSRHGLNTVKLLSPES